MMHHVHVDIIILLYYLSIPQQVFIWFPGVVVEWREVSLVDPRVVHLDSIDTSDPASADQVGQKAGQGGAAARQQARPNDRANHNSYTRKKMVNSLEEK